jgi:hypothetical protein
MDEVARLREECDKAEREHWVVGHSSMRQDVYSRRVRVKRWALLEARERVAELSSS